jgi:hypothetical protein
MSTYPAMTRIMRFRVTANSMAKLLGDMRRDGDEHQPVVRMVTSDGFGANVTISDWCL